MVGEILVISNLIDGKYVEYRRLIPNSTETVLKIKRADFLQTIKVAEVFTRDSGGSITLRADEENSKLSIHTIASEVGESTSETDAEISGGGEVTLNVAYIKHALGNLKISKSIFWFFWKIGPNRF